MAHAHIYWRLVLFIRGLGWVIFYLPWSFYLYSPLNKGFILWILFSGLCSTVPSAFPSSNRAAILIQKLSFLAFALLQYNIQRFLFQFWCCHIDIIWPLLCCSSVPSVFSSSNGATPFPALFFGLCSGTGQYPELFPPIMVLPQKSCFLASALLSRKVIVLNQPCFLASALLQQPWFLASGEGAVVPVSSCWLPKKNGVKSV